MSDGQIFFSVVNNKYIYNAIAKINKKTANILKVRYLRVSCYIFWNYKTSMENADHFAKKTRANLTNRNGKQKNMPTMFFIGMLYLDQTNCYQFKFVYFHMVLIY